MPQRQQSQTGRGALLLKALTHNLRFRIMITLTDREASPKELAEIHDADFKRVCDHVKLLERDGLIELVDTDSRLGGTQHFFRAKARPFVSTEDTMKLSLARRVEISDAICQAIIVDLVRATESGSMDSRPDRVLVRMPLILDEEACREADDSVVRHMEELHDIQARSAERRAVTGDPGINASSVTAIFPVPKSES
jgi:Helix-turn-helix domain